MKDVTMPALGMAMTEGLLVRWLKQPGDRVNAGDPVAEIETDKASLELESPDRGILGPHLVTAGEVVPIGGLLAKILTDEEALSAPSDDTRNPGARAATEPSHSAIVDGAPLRTEAGPRQPHRLSPRQRHLAALAQTQSKASPEPMAHSRRRQAIATQVMESWQQVPHFAVGRELDVQEIIDEMERVRHRLPSATITDLLLRAFALALADTLNLAHVDVGLAVATEDGVMTPVVATPDALPVSELVDARAAAVARARSGRLNQHDMVGRPTGTLSNLGPFDVDWFTGIIPLGQLCLLTVGKIAPRVVARDGQPVVRMTALVTLNVDHRSLDGDTAAKILQALERHLADQIAPQGAFNR